ncbi:hypothetical protein KFK09_028341 [Dendrobium nobile]|uniref:DUF4283 domain-containing protein n=1 Tax=Dendrobium nobile TaxID=94219 RepID=A0A8T3A2V2_DENNO|nr:hypothetical protein KFK09_028341 [Dendrobium nobile]
MEVTEAGVSSTKELTGNTLLNAWQKKSHKRISESDWDFGNFLSEYGMTVQLYEEKVSENTKALQKFNVTWLGKGWCLCLFEREEAVESILVNGPCFASKVGKPYLLDENMFQWGRREYARIFVHIKLEESLSLGVWIGHGQSNLHEEIAVMTSKSSDENDCYVKDPSVIPTQEKLAEANTDEGSGYGLWIHWTRKEFRENNIDGAGTADGKRGVEPVDKVDKGGCSPKAWDRNETEEFKEGGSSNIKIKLAKELRSLGPTKLLPRGTKMENEIKERRGSSSPFVP